MGPLITCGGDSLQQGQAGIIAASLVTLESDKTPGMDAYIFAVWNEEHRRKFPSNSSLIDLKRNGQVEPWYAVVHLTPRSGYKMR